MQERIEYTACPLCDAPEIAEVYRGDCTKHGMYDAVLSPEIIWKKCGACNHVFTSGHFTPEVSEVIFSRLKDSRKVGYNLEQNRKVSARIIEKVLPYADSGRWLDVGFGNGALLLTAREFGFEPVGVDLRKDNVNALHQLGVEAYCEQLESLGGIEKCSVVSMMDVLEHVPHPKQFLTAARDLMADGTPLAISMPNSESHLWDYATASGQNPYWGELEHFHNFSRTRLYALLEETGFKPVRFGLSERYRMCMEVIAQRV